MFFSNENQRYRRVLKLEINQQRENDVDAMRKSKKEQRIIINQMLKVWKKKFESLTTIEKTTNFAMKQLQSNSTFKF